MERKMRMRSEVGGWVLVGLAGSRPGLFLRKGFTIYMGAVALFAFLTLVP